MTVIDVVVPAYNEERDLRRSILCLHTFLTENITPHQWGIVIANNGSNDRTASIADEIAEELPGVRCLHLDTKGRGRALRHAWLKSNADVVTYMDVDLSTDLSDFLPLVAAIIDEGYDIAIGSRLMEGAQVTGRSLGREVTSRTYVALIRILFPSPLTDAQCGFKAISKRAAVAILPLIKDNAWFFDTELLLLAQKSGYRIKEIPVRWSDDPDSRVRILSTAWRDLKGLLRLRFKGIPVTSKSPWS